MRAAHRDLNNSGSLRVVAIDDFPHAELVEQDIGAIFTVEP